MTTRRITPWTLAIVLGLLLVPASVFAQAVADDQPQGVLGEEAFTGQTAKAPQNTGPIERDGMQQWIVVLEDAPIATYGGGIPGFTGTSRQATGAQRVDFNSPAANAYRDFLRDKQDRMLNEIRSFAPETRLLYNYFEALNGMALAVPAATSNRLPALNGVSRVYPDTWNTVTMDASLDLINAPDFWAALGGQSNAGAGIKVAVLDTGIRPENACFDGAGFTAPAGFPLADDWCSTNPGFCNGKLIAARHFNVGFGPLLPEEIDSPLAARGHGVHVAGSAVCNSNVFADAGGGQAANISGVAPAAHLMAYKGLWWNGTTGSGTNTDLVAGLNAAIADGADVINNSWGGGGGADPNTSVYTPILAAAEAANIVVVSAAGNSGPGPMSVGCPACAEPGLGVANSTTNRMFAFGFNVVGGGSALTGVPALEGTGPALGADVGPAPLVYAGDVDAANFEGCVAFPAGSFTGAVALISRGSCSFATKVTNAEAAGAIFAIIFNNLPGATPFTMGGLNAGETISSAMISKESGDAAVAFIGLNPGSQATVDQPASRRTSAAFEDLMAGSSSRGPNGDPDVLKPDIAAPGTRILSAWSPDNPPNAPNPPFTVINGTSMASPHVAGAAALLRQQNPTWTAVQIKTALTSTANRTTLVKEDSVTPADPFDQGGGRMDLAYAANAAATFDVASIAEDNCFLDCSFNRSITNVTGATQTFIAAVDNSLSPGLAVTVTPSQLTVGPGGTANFTVDVNTAGATIGGWNFAYVVWRDSNNSLPQAGMPLAIFATGSTGTSLLLDKTASATSAMPGDVVEFTVTATNLGVTGQVDVTDTLPDNLVFVDSDPVEVDGVPTVAPTFDAGPPQTVSWSGTLGQQSLAVKAAPSPFGYFSLAGLGVTRQPCSTVCDDTSITFAGLPAFNYLGQEYTDIVVGSNGFIVIGGDNTGAFTNGGQNMPDPTAPNNVVAALWTDLDLDGTNVGDTGNGSIYVATVNAGPSQFIVVEWEDAELWNNPGINFTFQIWIEVGTSNIWIVYDQLTAIPAALAIGAEDAAGISGDTYYFNGTGTAPVVGTDLSVNSVPGGTAVIRYRAEVTADGGATATNVVEATDSTGGTVAQALASVSIGLDVLDIPTVGEMGLLLLALLLALGGVVLMRRTH